MSASWTFAGVVRDGKIRAIDRSEMDRFAALLGNGVEVDITVAERKDSRSARQNRTYWRDIIGVLAEHLGYDHDERTDLHEGLLAEYAGTHTDKATGREVPNKRSSTMKVDEFSEYMDWCVRWAAKLPNPCVLTLPSDREAA